MSFAPRPWLQWQDGDLILQVQIQPRASKDEIAGAQGERLKIRITAPPVDGQANQHLIRYLAKTFKVPKSRVIIESGENSRLKRIRIENPQKLPCSLS